MEYEIVECDNGFPNFVLGRMSDGRPFYFCAQHGWWKLLVGQPNEPLDAAKSGQVVLSKEEGGAGGWNTHEILTWTKAALKEYEQKEQ